ncbi:MAG: 16S rRNA (guanine(527)-N(7))-methyltransferase RsmG, partial [Dehalobacterium sp.]
MTEFVESLSGGLEEIGFDFTEEQLDKCQKYHDLLMEWNSKINLTAIKDQKEIAIKHFIDSIMCLKYVNINSNENLIDVGSGAGFPGLPIKIFFPAIRLVLLDSLAKRCIFLEKIIDKLELKDVSVVQGRAEDKGKDPEFREKFALATARAVTNLPVLAEYCLPFLKIG